MAEPSKIPVAFASSGDMNTIPESDAESGYASWATGFGAVNSLSLANGGIPPKRLDFNGIFNALSESIVWTQKGGQWTYDSTVSYEAGNIILGSDGGLYFCVSASTGVDPAADTSGSWRCVVTADGTINADAFGAAVSLITDLTSESAAELDGSSSSLSLGVTGVLSVAHGGTGESSLDDVTVGKATQADELSTARSMTVNLESEEPASFDGTSDISIGVSGVLSVEHGGTGATSLADVTVGKASQADELTTARTITVNLESSEAASFDGSEDITTGVSGVLGVENGGTGATSLEDVTVGKAITAETADALACVESDSLDADSTTSAGLYSVDGSQTNTPTENAGLVEVVVSGDYLLQTYTDLTTGVMYIRTASVSDDGTYTWSEWTELASSSTVAEALAAAEAATEAAETAKEAALIAADKVAETAIDQAVMISNLWSKVREE